MFNIGGWKKRSFEKYWQESANTDFLRNKRQLNHPSRPIIADIIAEYGDNVLEVACCTAIDYPLHVERGTHYVGVDITPKFVEAARVFNPGIDVREGTALHLEFENQKFHSVYIRALLEHMKPMDRMPAVKEAWRIAERMLLICLYRAPFFSEHVRTKSSDPFKLSSRVNGSELVETIEALPDAKLVQQFITERKGRSRPNWIYVVERVTPTLSEA